MLPAKSGTGGVPEYGTWPIMREIDVMEAVNDLRKVLGSVHFKDPEGQLGGMLQ
jgi:hypothetical protein